MTAQRTTQEMIAQLRATERTTVNPDVLTYVQGIADRLEEMDELLVRALPYVESEEEFNKPTCRTLSKRIRLLVDPESANNA